MPFRARRGFIGVTARRAGKHLHERGRRVPFDVWCALADGLMAGLETVDPADELWGRWKGPDAFGIDLEGRVVLFDEPCTSPSLDWVYPDVGGMSSAFALGRSRVWAVCRALVWLIDPFPTPDAGAGSSKWFERTFEHPDLPKPVALELERGLSFVGAVSIEALRLAIRSKAHVMPATPQRLQKVLFAGGFETPTGDDLPPRWRGGALEVHLDTLLERCEPIDSCPADPRAQVNDERSLPLTPTRTLRLALLLEGRELRAVPVTAERGLPERVALPVGSNLRVGTTLGLELRHPEQRAFAVALEGTVGADRFVTLALDAKARGEVEVLLASLDAQAPAPAPAPRPIPPRPGPALTPPVTAREVNPSRNITLVRSFVLVLFFALLLVIGAGLLTLVGVLSGKTFLLGSLGSLLATWALVLFQLRRRLEG